MANRIPLVWLPAVLWLTGASACQSSMPEPERASHADTAQAAPREGVAPLVPCGSGAPHIDREKLHQLLLEQGMITPEMTPQQQQQILNDYIRQRQQAYKKCKQEPKP
ncbi:hypothetical protein [Shewanella sp. YIC-542]|uniref:hypothetical protein n=1 Tax=Shewanella mytili TaxID=3377111 RepID=UPI00398F8547